MSLNLGFRRCDELKSWYSAAQYRNVSAMPQCQRWQGTIGVCKGMSKTPKLAPQDEVKPNIPHQHPPLLFKTLSSTTVLPAKLGSMCGPTSTTYSAGQM